MFSRHFYTVALAIIAITASCGSNTNGGSDATTAGVTTGSHFDAAGVTGLGSGGGSTVGMPEGGDAPHGDATTGSRIDASTTSASPDANSTGGDATTTSGGTQTSTGTTGTAATTGSQTTGVGIT